MSLTFRSLQWLDALPLFVWRTDSETVHWSLKPPPTWEEHLRWMNETLSELHGKWIGLYDPNTPVVFVRCDRQTVSVTVNPKMRGLGYGFDAIRHLQKTWDHLDASIMFGNTASLKLFSKCGFQIKDMDDKCIIMEWRKA